MLREDSIKYIFTLSFCSAAASFLLLGLKRTFTKYFKFKLRISVLKLILTLHFISFTHRNNNGARMSNDLKHNIVFSKWVANIICTQSIGIAMCVCVFVFLSKVHHLATSSSALTSSCPSPCHHIKVSQAISFNFRMLSISIPWLVSKYVQNRNVIWVLAVAASAVSASPFHFA